MGFARFRDINQYYFAGYEKCTDANDAADEIIAAPDRHILDQSELFQAQGGWNTVGLSLAAASLGTLAVFAGSPRTAAHFRNGSLGFYEWACLLTSGVAWYGGAQMVGNRTFGDSQKLHNHWMAYTFVKAQNRFEGRRILTKKPTY